MKIGSILLDFLLEENKNDLREKIFNYCFMNLKQIEVYMTEFQADFGKLTEEEFIFFLQKIEVIEQRYYSYKQLGFEKLKDEDFMSFVSDIKEIMTNIKNKYREIWTEFNLKLMFLGVFINIISIVIGIQLMCFIDYHIQTECRFIENEFLSSNEIYRFIKISIFLCIGFIGSSFIYEFEILVVSAIFCFILSFFFLYFCHKMTENLKGMILRKEKRIEKIKNVFQQNLLGNLIFWMLQISHGYMLFAVSHIRNEGQAILFIIFFVNLLYIYMSWKDRAENPKKSKKSIFGIIIINFLLYIVSFYENSSMNKEDITLKKVISN